MLLFLIAKMLATSSATLSCQDAYELSILRNQSHVRKLLRNGIYLIQECLVGKSVYHSLSPAVIVVATRFNELRKMGAVS